MFSMLPTVSLGNTFEFPFCQLRSTLQWTFVSSTTFKVAFVINSTYLTHLEVIPTAWCFHMQHIVVC